MALQPFPTPTGTPVVPAPAPLFARRVALDRTVPPLAAIAAIPGSAGRFLGLAVGDGTLWRLDAQRGTAVSLLAVPPDARPTASRHLPAHRETGFLVVSPDGRWAVCGPRGARHAALVDLAAERVHHLLDRGDEWASLTDAPFAFFRHGGRVLLVCYTGPYHLDVVDPETGVALTARSALAHDDPRRHDDYLARLAVSPDGRRLLATGFVWHPVGIVVAWDIARWLADPHGLVVQQLVIDSSERHLGGSACWLDDDTIAAGDTSVDLYAWDRLVPTASRAGESPRLRTAVAEIDDEDELVACRGQLVAYGGDAAGVTVWDPATGALVATSHGTRARAIDPEGAVGVDLAPDGDALVVLPLDPQSPSASS